MTALTGAREAAAGGARALIAWAMARDLRAFVVPGADVARAHGLDFGACRLHLADTPRHANVLLVAGPLPPALLDAACVAWAQMPRPRAVMALGASSIAPLPGPDAAGALSQAGLAAGLALLRPAFAAGAFAREVTGFDAPPLAAQIEYTCPMHPEVVSAQPGTCPKCGMDLVVRETVAGGHAGHTAPVPPVPPVPSIQGAQGAHGAHGAHDARGAGMHADHAGRAGTPKDDHDASYTCPMHPEVTLADPGSCPICGMALVPRDATSGHASHSGPEDRAVGADRGGHAGHGSQGSAAPHVPGIEPHFMSMVDVTRDMPASRDGLKMEWIDVPFGPFFPGLPGGLGLMLTLDGDSVARAEARSLATGAPAPGFAATELPGRLALASPLAPVALRELACRALEAATGRAPAPGEAAARAAAVERERLASHFTWIAGMARQVGLFRLERRAARLQQELRRDDATGIARRGGDLSTFVTRLLRTPLLREKLSHAGRLGPEAAAGLGGPVARAAGNATDERADDPAYAGLGFAPLTQSGGDAWARLVQRLAEIEQSLDLIARAGAVATPAAPADLHKTGHGMASIETPRGRATLHLTLKGGTVEALALDTPFDSLAALVGPLTAGAELADALTAVGSLDLDPWGAAS